jgi:hypothetical protein
MFGLVSEKKFYREIDKRERTIEEYVKENEFLTNELTYYKYMVEDTEDMFCDEKDRLNCLLEEAYAEIDELNEEIIDLNNYISNLEKEVIALEDEAYERD